MEKIKTQLNIVSKHLAVSGLSSGVARIKNCCILTGNRFEMPNVSYRQPLAVIQKQDTRIRNKHEK